MSCELHKENGKNSFRCSNIGSFEYLEDGIGNGGSGPYEDNECTHEKRFMYKGELRCENCDAVYDENCLGWR